MHYYRVETMESSSSKTVGGFVSAAIAMMHKALGTVPGCSAQELCDALRTTKSTNARILYRNMSILIKLVKPDVYINDQANNYCLYTGDGLWAATPSLKKIDKAIRKESNGLYFLTCRRITVPKTAIIYEDEDQIVITKADYMKYSERMPYIEMSVWEDDWSEQGA